MEINTDDTAKLNFAIDFLDRIFAAAGDPEGKLTPIELVERISRMREALKVIRGVPFVHATSYRNNIRSIAKEALQ